MKSHTLQIRPSQLALLLLGPLALPLLLGLAMRTASSLLPPPLPILDMERTIISHQAHAAQNPGRPEIILLGDSSCMMNISAPLLQNSLPGRPAVLNLGTLSYLGLDAARALLSAALAHGAQPKTIILLMHPEALRLGQSHPYYRDFLHSRLQAIEPPSPSRSHIYQLTGTDRLRNRLLTRAIPIPLRGEWAQYYGFTANLWQHLTGNRGSAIDPRQFIPADAEGSPEYRLAPTLQQDSAPPPGTRPSPPAPPAMSSPATAKPAALSSSNGPPGSRPISPSPTSPSPSQTPASPPPPISPPKPPKPTLLCSPPTSSKRPPGGLEWRSLPAASGKPIALPSQPLRSSPARPALQHSQFPLAPPPDPALPFPMPTIPSPTRFRPLLPALLLLLSLLPVSAATLKGQIDFSGGQYTLASPFAKNIGSESAAVTQWYTGRFFGADGLFANLKIKNPTDRPIRIEYFVAFYDGQRSLIATAAQSTISKPIQPGQELIFASCLIRLPKSELHKIKSYEIILHEFQETAQQP